MEFGACHLCRGEQIQSVSGSLLCEALGSNRSPLIWCAAISSFIFKAILRPPLGLAWRKGVAVFAAGRMGHDAELMEDWNRKENLKMVV